MQLFVRCSSFCVHTLHSHTAFLEETHLNFDPNRQRRLLRYLFMFQALFLLGAAILAKVQANDATVLTSGNFQGAVLDTPTVWIVEFGQPTDL
jgi:hypothetical protein